MASIFENMRKVWLDREEWPPKSVKDNWERIETFRMYYRNNRSELISHNPNISISNHKVDIYIPVPWAREICRFSAGLLFPQSPRIMGKDKLAILDLEQINDFGAFAIQGGVQVAAEGRLGIRIIKDPVVSNVTPLLTIVPDDQIIWDIRHGRFYVGGMVIIERKVEPESASYRNYQETIYYRLMEEHTIGQIKRTLYKGTYKSLGVEVPLSTYNEFASLPDLESTGLDTPTLIPWENVPGAESDLFGLTTLLDVINEGESLLLDRARKAIPRVFIDRSLSDESGRIDIDGYILTGGSRLRMPLGVSPGQSINLIEPKFFAKEHVEWLDHVTQLMVTVAGYSPSTWGIQGHTATVSRVVSGYALKLSQLRTLLNRSAKEHMALQALGWSVAVALSWASSHYNVQDNLPTIELGDGLPSDPLDGAQEVLYLKQALAASTETLVKTVHPSWTPEEIAAEVKAIEDEISYVADLSAKSPSTIAGSPIPKPNEPKLRNKNRAGDGVDEETNLV